MTEWGCAEVVPCHHLFKFKWLTARCGKQTSAPEGRIVIQRVLGRLEKQPREVQQEQVQDLVSGEE